MSLNMTAILPILLLAPAPAYLLGSTIGSETGAPRPMQVKTYEGRVMCVINLVDRGDHAEINAKKCTAMGNFAKVARVSGSYPKQIYVDASGATVAEGTQKSDGYWFNYDGKRYQLYRQP
ncbi:MAG: hypothetical protein EOP21_13020, partial [Hyphomicrobiales bacterium]